MSGSFADSNILIYALSKDATKADIAEAILLDRDFAISAQVLNEVAVVLLRRHQMEWEALHDFLAKIKLAARAILPLTTEVHDHGLQLAQSYKFRVYDGMIVAAALLAECDALYSEDMHHGLVVDGRLQIVNPFREP
jgi:predicted nucleic acid-binding protein